MIVTRTVDWLEPLSLKVRSELLARPPEHATFRAALADISALHAIAVHSLPRPATTGNMARIVFWNAERLKALEPSAALLGSLGADVLILCEVDVGMARSGNRDTIAELARSVDAGFIFGVEFVELGLGDLREQRWHSGQTNVAGLHGAGFVSRARLDRPALVRLESSGRWFDGAFHERRVGGRIAMLAELTIADVPVVLVSAHFESHTDPADRLLQTKTMLDAIDSHATGKPVLIAGDFNTSTFSLAEKQDLAFVREALAKDPHRLVDPVAYEPMFGLLCERGYGWESCNLLRVPTQRTRPDGTPQPPFGRIDWLFSRGLRCSAPAVVPAIDSTGQAISDHEALTVAIAPDQSR